MAELERQHPLVQAATFLPRRPSTAPEPEQIDLVGNLAQLRKIAAQLQQDLFNGVPITEQRWADLAQVFKLVAEECRRQVVIDAEQEPS